MWTTTCVTAAAGVGGTAYWYSCVRREKWRPDSSDTLSQRLHEIRTVDDVIGVLQRVAHRSPTEDVAAKLSEAFELCGVDEELLKRLSDIHRKHGGDLGVRGYAINMLWSVLISSVAEGKVVILAE